jgi:hypothetical protein
MATMSELHAEYHTLNSLRQRLIEERGMLEATGGDGAAFQDLAHRTRQYVNALEIYTAKLRMRRQELRVAAASHHDAGERV